MIHAKRNLTTLLVVSLFIAVISLSGAVSLAAVAPVVTAMPPVRDGMLTPVRLALDPSGNAFYVSDARAKAILKYNVYGHLVQTIKTAGIPIGIAVSGSGDSLRVLVTQGKYVAVYNPATGAEEQRIGVGVVAKANGVAVDGVDGSVYVADGGLHQVHVFDAAGVNLKMSIGSYYGGANPPAGTFYNPSSVVYEKANRRIAVVDTNNGRIQFFNAADPNYGYVGTIGAGSLNDARLDFVSAQGVAFEYTQAGSLSRMYVADTWKGGVQVIDPVTPATGTYLSLIGAGKLAAGAYPTGILSGVENYQFLLPTDVQYDPVYRRLFVVCADSSIKVLGIDGGKSPSDNLPLFLVINPAPLNTNVSTYAISGTVKPGSSVKITTDTGAVAGPIVYSGSNWSTTLSGLALGSNKVTALAVDVTGAQMTKDVTIAYTLNAPALTITTANGTVLGQLSATLQGTVDAGCAVIIKNNTTQVETAATVTGATWSGVSTLSNNVANNFTVTARKAGSNDATANVTIVSDTTPPILHISALPDGSYSSGTMTQNVSGYVQDANPATVSVVVNNGTPTVVSTPLPAASFSVPVTLQAGANTITVQATDLGGKTSWVNTRTINYDAARPQLTLAANPGDNSFTKTVSVVVSGTVTPANATIAMTNNGVAVAGVTNVSGSLSGTVSLVAGQNTIVVTATSGASDASLKRTITLDTAAPALAVTSPATDVAINLPNIQITGTVSGGADGYPAITATINSVPVTPPTVNNGTFTFNTGTSLVAGANVISITATDSANNTTTVTRSVNYDTVPPSLTLNPIVSGNPRTISGTVEALASVSVTDGATSFTVTPSGTTWTADLSTSDYNATTIQIKAVDAAGNASVITGLAGSYDKPTGDIDGSGVSASDALQALRFAVGLDIPTAAQLKAADIGPLLKGAANPDGKIDITDAILILRKSVDPAFSW